MIRNSQRWWSKNPCSAVFGGFLNKENSSEEEDEGEEKEKFHNVRHGEAFTQPAYQQLHHSHGVEREDQKHQKENHEEKQQFHKEKHEEKQQQLHEENKQLHEEPWYQIYSKLTEEELQIHVYISKLQKYQICTCVSELQEDEKLHYDKYALKLNKASQNEKNQQLLGHEKDQQQKQQLQQFHGENQQLYEENQQLYEENQQLYEENRQQKQQLHGENQQLYEENRQLHGENQQQQQQLQQLYEENQQQKQQLQQFYGENQQQKQQLQQFYGENQQQKQQLQQLHEENQQQKQQLQQFYGENQQQKQQLQQLHEENQQQKQQLQQLHEENQQQKQQLQQFYGENQQQKQQLQQLHEENQQQKQQLQQLHEENQQQKQQLQQLHEENQQQKQQLQQKNQQLHEANEKFQGYNSNLQEGNRKHISMLQKENQKLPEFEEQKTNQKGRSAQSHQDILYEFQEHYDYMENDAPNDLGIKGVANKQEFWKKCCHSLYQTSYDICFDKIQSVFHEALTSITRLSNEEEERGEVMFSRQKNLINAKAAYQYLLKQCSVQLNEFDKTPLVTKVLESFNAADHDWLQEEAETAVEICWKMQTVSPPMFLCQPTKHNGEWHQIHYKSWHEGPGELIYYRPVVMYSAGGIVACKGFIGKTLDESNVISPCTSYDHSGANNVCTTQIVKKAVCSGCQMECQDTQETINHNGKYWHEKCLPICSKCNNYVDVNESRKSGKHHYHYDCFICHHCRNTIPTSENCHSLPAGSSIIWCNGCYHKLCLCCHNEIRSATSQSHCDNCMHKISMSICFECNQKIELHDEKTTTNRGIFHKTCICDCQDASAYNHLKICSKCNKKRY